MRDWTKTLGPASFRGAPFKVDKEEISRFGRRVATHEYVKAEEHGTEDMGRLPREFRLTAYIAEDEAQISGRALVTACSTRGAATLVLPFYGGNQVRCQGGRAAHEKDKLGYVAFAAFLILLAGSVDGL